MNIYPQHLREQQHGEIIFRRMIGRPTGPLPPSLRFSESRTTHRVGGLGKLWAKGLHLTDREAAIGLAATSVWPFSMLKAPKVSLLMLLSGVPSTAMLTYAAHFLPIPLGEVCVGGASVCMLITWLATIQMPRASFRALYEEPLSKQEIDALLPEATSDLERAHLLLIQNAIVTEASSVISQDLLTTIQAIGKAVDHLPLIPGTSFDPLAARNEMTTLLEAAQQEPDRAIAESLARRADALARRADANAQSVLANRRAQTERAEMIGQMDALREGLAGFQIGVSNSVALERLAEDAKRIAVKATAVAQAREELDAPIARTSVNASIQAIQQVGSNIK